VAGDSGTALRFAEEARRGLPSSLATRATLARALLTTGDLARAESEIAELLKGAPNEAVPHALQGALLLQRRNPTAARSAYERALQLSPGMVEAVGGLAAVDLRLNAPDRAIARLEAEVAKQPQNTVLLLLSAQTYEVAGQMAKAEQALRAAVAADPRFLTGYQRLARLYIGQGKIDAARAEFEGIAQRDPTNVPARTMVGVLLETQGRRDQAQEVYEDIVKGNETAAVAANNLAYIYAERGTNLDIALQLASSAKQQLPENADVDDTLGWVYYKRDLASLAVPPLQAALGRRPDHPEILYHLGLAYAKLGDTARARDALSRAVRGNPNVGGGEAKRALASLAQ
jgi:tetratricopeptide (TPR) repeat protein